MDGQFEVFRLLRVREEVAKHQDPVGVLVWYIVEDEFVREGDSLLVLLEQLKKCSIFRERVQKIFLNSREEFRY